MEEYIPLFSEHFKKEDLETALRISWCESRGKPTAVGVNKDGTKDRSEEHTSELQSRLHLVCRLLLEKKK